MKNNNQKVYLQKIYFVRFPVSLGIFIARYPGDKYMNRVSFSWKFKSLEIYILDFQIGFSLVF